MNVGMKRQNFAFLIGVLLPFSVFAAQEGTPVYYQNQTNNANQANYGYYQNQGYTNYVGQSGQKQVVGSRNYSYQVPRAQLPTLSGTMTTNGVALPASQESTYFYADYGREFANFQFETGVNSILKWDDMVLNEITVGIHHNFSLRNTDLFLYGEYTMGTLSNGGLSMDYDLKPYDTSDPKNGIFTISMGDMSGSTNDMRFGIGAHHVWDVGGWKLSPSFGYEIFKHNLEMSNHIYPNPGIYLPLMTSLGDYVFGDDAGNYYTLPTTSDVPEDWYQVCLSPEDIMVVPATTSGTAVSLGDTISTVEYDPAMGILPWGVGTGECVIIGGDGMIKIDGTTHIYNTTWSGFYVGLEMEKQMTLTDKLRFYVQLGMPNYSSEGIWPNRTDWQQNPSFIDEGNNGSYSYRAEMEYDCKISDRMQLSLKVDTRYLYVGKIPGELYVSEYSQYLIDENGQYILDDNNLPILETVAAHTELISDSLKSATWQSFGLHLGLKYAF
ncbi:MAG: hypothetical protein JW974_01540 [Alphaproteobacteria bacterium]|nr:hypothetical protein [Alphaproteobacteria bacterium]MBN2675465.1 hypothetical protein [Alphaproteobacteria bacterium]